LQKHDQVSKKLAKDGANSNGRVEPASCIDHRPYLNCSTLDIAIVGLFDPAFRVQQSILLSA
jgi:hypothetical protein